MSLLDWKKPDTAAQSSTSPRRTSARRTAGSGSSLLPNEWPTPLASMPDRGPCPSEMDRRSPFLPAVVLMIQQRHPRVPNEWPTPRASPNENRQTKPSPSQLAGKHGMSLGVAVNWPTPTARDHKDTGDLSRINARPGRPPDLVPRMVQALDPKNTAPLNPAWVEQLMGFPDGWTELPPEVLGRLVLARRKPRGKRPAPPPASEPAEPA